jgi:hypothetical protein
MINLAPWHPDPKGDNRNGVDPLLSDIDSIGLVHSFLCRNMTYLEAMEQIIEPQGAVVEMSSL